MIGEMIGSYRVLSQIGQGGMGVVYLAEHPLIGRKVAIKVILPEHSHQKDALTRFFNEARATARLRHPALVDTIDFGTHANGSAFIIMEYLEGEDLGARLRRVHRLPAWEAARIGRQIAEGVGVAHAARIVHRDLKPDNVFLTPHPSTGDDQVKILDFGIAKLAGPDGGGGQTRTGVMVGTPLFMAPEQCRGAGQIDHRADIYSLGCMLYRMLCGQPPFIHEGIGELIAAHLMETPMAPRALVPELPAPFEALVMRAMAKRPEDRQQTMAEVIQELDAASVALMSAANAVAGGRTMVLDVVPSTPYPPLATSRPNASVLAGVTPLPGRPNPGSTPAPPAAASPHLGFEGRTQVLPPSPAPLISAEQSQRLRKTTFSGSAGVVDDAAAESLKPQNKSKGRTAMMAAAALVVLGVAGVAALSGNRPGTTSPAARPVAEEPAVPPAPPPAPTPPPPSASPAAKAEKPAEPTPAPAEAPAHRGAEASKAASSSSGRSKSVRITIANAPEELTVLVDGRPGRLPVKLPLDLKPHTLRFESARTRPETKTITADHDQTVELTNKPKLLIE
jgi:serine/threonine protein kinase